MVLDAARFAEVSKARAEARRANAVQRLTEEYALTEEDAISRQGAYEVPADAPGIVQRLRREIRAMGDVNTGAIEAYERLNRRFEELDAQRADILEGIAQVEAGIRELDKLTRDRFVTTFAAVDVAFAELFQRLFGGGEGKLAMTDAEHVLDSGIEILITLPGKRRQSLALLSGGERALSAVAFLFALLKVRPSPLVVLDEVDAPLDGRNVERFGETLLEIAKKIQFIVITHNPTTIEMADTMLGVSMQEPGVSVLLPVRLPAPA
jgi:chromosome segregation protein